MISIKGRPDKYLKALAALFVVTMMPVGTPPTHARDAFDVSQLSQVAPSLVHYSHEVVGKLWERPELSPRDRSLVTLAALIARAHTNELQYYVGLALDELTETKRAQLVSQSFGSTAPGLVQYTTDVLFRQLWLRPPRA